MRLQLADGSEPARDLSCSTTGRQLQHNGRVPVRSRHRYGILQAATDSRMLKNQSRMNKLNRFQVHGLFRQIGTEEIKAGQTRIALAHSFKINRVQIDSNHPASVAPVDVVESVTARNSQDCD